MGSRRDHNFNPFNPSPEHQAILDSVSGFDRDGVDYSDPATIAALLGGPVPPTMKPLALQKRVQAMSKDIFESHANLQGIRKCRPAQPAHPVNSTTPRGHHPETLAEEDEAAEAEGLARSMAKHGRCAPAGLSSFQEGVRVCSPHWDQIQG